MQARYVQTGDSIDFTPESDTAAGAVVVVDQMVGICDHATLAGEVGALQMFGVWDIVKNTGEITAGEAVFWDADANPVNGVAGTGAADDNDDTGNNLFLGWAIATAASGAERVRVLRSNGRDLTVNFGGDIRAAIADPGDAGAIPVTSSGYIAMVSTEVGGETRTLAAPSFVGQELLIFLKTDGGTVVLTCATGLNETGNTIATFDNEGESLHVRAVEDGANLRWRFAAVDGAALSGP